MGRVLVGRFVGSSLFVGGGLGKVIGDKVRGAGKGSSEENVSCIGTAEVPGVGEVFVGVSVNAVGQSVMKGALVVGRNEGETINGRVDGACRGITVGSSTFSGSKTTVGKVVFFGSTGIDKVGVGTSVVSTSGRGEIVGGIVEVGPCRSLG